MGRQCSGLLTACWTAVVCFCGTASAEVSPTFDHVRYGPHYRHFLDVYLPPGEVEPMPVVLFIHGGGWVVGDKDHVQTYVDELLVRGLAVVSMNYRFSSIDKHPAQIRDCKGVVRWVRAQAAEYGFDPSRVGVLGESSGGHLAALLATSAGDSLLEGTVGGNESFGSSVQACVNLYGPIDLFAMGEHNPSPLSEESKLIGHHIAEINHHVHDPAWADRVALVASASPNHQVTAESVDLPPTWIVHGNADTLVPFSQAEALHGALLGAAGESTLQALEGRGHDDYPPEARVVMYEFLADQLGGHGPGAGCPGDITVNSVVDVDDIFRLLEHWGETGGRADVDSNGRVDVEDVFDLLGRWGQCP